jgi:hypothetical protein
MGTPRDVTRGGIRCGRHINREMNQHCLEQRCGDLTVQRQPLHQDHEVTTLPIETS